MEKSSKTIIDHTLRFLEYCEIEKGLSDKTQENYRNFLQPFVEWLRSVRKEKLKPHELTSEDLWNYRIFLSRKKNSTRASGVFVSKATQTHYLVALRNLLAYFTDKDILSLPSEKVKLPKERERSVKFLKLEQVEKLLLTPDIQKIDGLRDRAILESLFSTGLRVSELVALNRDQIVFSEKQDFLEVPIVGKGGAARTVYFSQRALGWILKYVRMRKDTFAPLFINYRGPKDASRRLTTRSVENIVKRYARIAGISVLATPHTIRHSYATDLLAQGVDLRLIQEFLGHKNIVTTQIYTHVVNKQLKDIHQKYHSGHRMKN